MNIEQTAEGEPQTSPVELLNKFWQTLLRRRWWFLITASVIVIGGLAVLARTPSRYTSEAMIVVARQRVPERYVVPTSTTDLTKDLRTMESEVLSRSRLLSLIEEFNLYPNQRKRVAPERLLEIILKDIKIEPLVPRADPKEADSFTVSFTAESPTVAQEVTSRVASLFILNDVKGREIQAVNTTNFLKEHLETSQKKLGTMEQNLREFKMQHLGELPEQQQGNLAILGGLQTQLQNTTAAIARAQQQRVYLESLISTLRGLTSRPGVPPASSHSGTSAEAGSGDDQALLGAELRLVRLKSERKALLSVRGPDDPEVTKMNVDIAKTEALVEKLRPAKVEQERPAEAEAASIAQLQSQMDANRLELQNLTRDEKQLKQAVAEYQNRLNQTPIREQQLAGMTREIELVQHQYADLLTKEQQSQLATSLEEQQGGQQFRLLEPPNLPTLPSSPNRPKIGIGVVAAGVVLGLAAALLGEFRNRSFYTERELTQAYAIPLVIGTPLFLTPMEKRRRRWQIRLEWVAGSALALFVSLAEVAYIRAWDIMDVVRVASFLGAKQ